jgi:diguanylate cyclase (GGDEF)-like protein/PAS domain S-box-containing protein
VLAGDQQSAFVYGFIKRLQDLGREGEAMVGLCLGVVGVFIGVIFSEQLKKMVWKGFNERTENEKRIYQLVESSKDIIYYCDIEPQLKYRYLSPAIEEILRPNLVKESMKNAYTAFEIIHPDDYKTLENKISGNIDYNKPILQRWRDDKGNYKWFEEYATPIYENGQLVALQGIIRNIDEKILLQKKLEYKIEHDSLTGIYNREFFERQIELYNEKKEESVALILCDLDELKWVNDTLGHKMGDQLIIETAAILNTFSKADVLVTRIGGDEFAILLTKTKLLSVSTLLTNIRNEVLSYNKKGKKFTIKLSLGYAFEPSSIGKMDDLFIMADRSMYMDKNKKKTLCSSR